MSKLAQLYPIYHKHGTTIVNIAHVDHYEYVFVPDECSSCALDLFMTNGAILRLTLTADTAELVIAALIGQYPPTEGDVVVGDYHEAQFAVSATRTIDTTQISYVILNVASRILAFRMVDGELFYSHGESTKECRNLITELLAHDSKRIDAIMNSAAPPSTDYDDFLRRRNVCTTPHHIEYAININYIQLAMLDGDKIIITWTNRELRDELEFSSKSAASDYFNKLLTQMSAHWVIPDAHD